MVIATGSANAAKVTQNAIYSNMKNIMKPLKYMLLYAIISQESNNHAI